MMRTTSSTVSAFAIPAILFAVIFGVYARTAAPEVTFHDSGELITAAYTLGIGHPPGSPTWCILGYLFTRLPFGSPAYRIHLMCGLFAALTCVFAYAVVLQILSRKGRAAEKWLARVAGAVSALVLAAVPAFWEKAVQAEIYTLNALFLIVILFLFVKWQDRNSSGDPQHGRIMILLAATFGIGTGNYMALLYYAPVVAIAVVWLRPGLFREWRLIVGCIAVFAGSLCIYLYLPIRSLSDPPMDWGNPETMSAFLSAMRREQWGELRPRPLSGRFILHWLTTYNFTSQMGIGSLLFAAWGIGFAILRDRAFALTALASLVVYGVIMMLMQATTMVLTEDMFFVRNYGIGEFHIPLYAILALFSGLGVYAVVEWVIRRRPGVAATLRSKIVLTTGLLLMFSAPGMARFGRCDYSGFYNAYEFDQEVLRSTPRGAWLLPFHENALFGLYYMKICKGERDDVRVLKTSRAGNNELANIVASGSASFTGEAIVDMFRSNPGLYFDPRLNQGSLASDGHPAIVFVGMPEFDKFWTAIHPHGLVFLLNSSGEYQEKAQMEYWETLLKRPMFELKSDSKSNFRENMVITLRSHALWHYRVGEYQLAKYLYMNAARYSTVVDPDLLSYACACMLELGELSEVVLYSRRIIELDSSNERAWNLRGIAYARTGELPSALECFQRVISINPDNQSAVNNVATLILSMGDQDGQKGDDGSAL